MSQLLYILLLTLFPQVSGGLSAQTLSQAQSFVNQKANSTVQSFCFDDNSCYDSNLNLINSTSTPMDTPTSTPDVSDTSTPPSLPADSPDINAGGASGTGTPLSSIPTLVLPPLIPILNANTSDSK